MDPANNLGYLVQHVATVMSKQADQLLQDQLGLGLSQFKILMVLQKNPKVQQRYIADSLGQTDASISRQIQLLHDRDLLTAHRNPLNRRTRVTTPTLQGTKLTEVAVKLLAKHFGPEFMAMGQQQFDQLLHNMQTLHDIVCQPGKTGACDHQIKADKH